MYAWHARLHVLLLLNFDATLAMANAWWKVTMKSAPTRFVFEVREGQRTTSFAASEPLATKVELLLPSTQSRNLNRKWADPI